MDYQYLHGMMYWINLMNELLARYLWSIWLIKCILWDAIEAYAHAGAGMLYMYEQRANI